MILRSNKIYAAQPLIGRGTTFPTVTITGSAICYVSNSDKRPTSIANMVEDTGFKVGVNTINGQVKWIAFVISSGTVEENGLIKTAETGYL